MQNHLCARHAVPGWLVGLLLRRTRRSAWATVRLSVAFVTLSGSAVAKDEAALAPYQLGGRFGIGAGSNGIYVLAQIDGGYRVFPALLLGASLENSLSQESISSDTCAR